MTDAQIIEARPDVDIIEDVKEIIAHYPPLFADRHHLRINARDGVLILGGHVSSPISRRYLMDRAGEVRGVIRVNCDALYDEENIRLDVGGALPDGVIANVRYGTAILTGKLPDGMNEESLAERVGDVRGVERVVAAFK
jgi:osmotically-inducible protein OsmY